MSAITAVQTGTNGELIALAQALYPMLPDDLVLDLTPGSKAGFWNEFKPARLEILMSGYDFRKTDEVPALYEHVVFDPPYVAPGGRDTSTTGEMNERYGMQDTESSPWAQWNTQIVPGVCEAHRLLKPRGLLWFKCMSYVSSGKVHWFAKEALPMLRNVGFELIDEFILAGHPGPQPKVNLDGTPRRQVHARQAHSHLLIARKRR